MTLPSPIKLSVHAHLLTHKYVYIPAHTHTHTCELLHIIQKPESWQSEKVATTSRFIRIKINALNFSLSTLIDAHSPLTPPVFPLIVALSHRALACGSVSLQLSCGSYAMRSCWLSVAFTWPLLLEYNNSNIHTFILACSCEYTAEILLTQRRFCLNISIVVVVVTDIVILVVFVVASLALFLRL